MKKVWIISAISLLLILIGGTVAWNELRSRAPREAAISFTKAYGGYDYTEHEEYLRRIEELTTEEFYRETVRDGFIRGLITKLETRTEEETEIRSIDIEKLTTDSAIVVISATTISSSPDDTVRIDRRLTVSLEKQGDRWRISGLEEEFPSG